MILIVSNDGDWSADAVAGQLAVRGQAFSRISTRDFPQRARLSARLDEEWTGTLATDGSMIDLADVTAVYYRRPGDFELPSGLSVPEMRFARAQARVGLGGILASLRCRWINSPAALADAEYKPRQLAVASAAGLSVPKTLITNEPARARAFAKAVGEVVVKPLAEPIVAEAGGYSLAYTRRLSLAELADLAGIEVTAHLVQEWIDKAYDARVTVVGTQMFAVAIHAGSDAGRTDFRADYDSLTYQPIDIPPAVSEGISEVLAQFNLVYGAVDFAVDHSGTWRFLEINGAGQFGWLVEECNLPIPAAIADELTRETT